MKIKLIIIPSMYCNVPCNPRNQFMSSKISEKKKPIWEVKKDKNLQLIRIVMPQDDQHIKLKLHINEEILFLRDESLWMLGLIIV